MRFQFTIRRLLVATAAFAAVLGVCAPFDEPGIVFGVPTSCVIFAFALFFDPQGIEQRSKTEHACYSSRREAVVTGLWRGAKCGAKWTAIVAGAWTSMFLAIAITMLTIKQLRRGSEIRIELEGAKMMCLVVLVFFAIPTAYSAIVGAVIMGIGGGVGYRRQPAEPEVQDRTE